ncbi:MAG: SGNH/GDSL hydrolase family protein [Nitrospirae bacterium]|nr:SGNH/GDSL hydrolase family protein [Nitrospirota bacterium]
MKIVPKNLLQKLTVRFKNILMAFCIFTLFIGTFEFLLRTTHLFNARISWAKTDPLFAWVNTPGATYWQLKENDHPITGKINKYGFRDNEWSLAKPPGTYRIAVLGDSYVEALQVESENSFLSLTAQVLNNNRKIKVELMNFGQSGFTQTDELITLKNKVIQFSPDMVILLFVPGNDIDDISKETASSSFRSFYNFDSNGQLILDTSFNKTRSYKIRSLLSPLKQHSALVSLILERYNAYVSSRAQKVTAPQNSIDGYLSLATKSPAPAFLRSYNLCKLLIKTMADICLEKKIKFMLVTIDNGSTYLPNVEGQYKAMDATFNVNFFEDDLSEYAKSLDIEYIGLQRVFRESYQNNSVLLHWGHWNYEGHKLVAEALSDKLNNIIHLNQ